jgi:ketosteroid isomerase-like protein
MTEQTRDTVRAYHEAWTAGDIEAAGRHLADDFNTRAPVGTYDTKDEYLVGLKRFRGLVTGLDLISELYGDGEATLIYDVHTDTPAGTLPTAEHFEVAGDKIASTMLIFDATDWKAMLASQGASVDAEGRVTRP